MTPVRIVANTVATMLIIQVILGGASSIFGYSKVPHIAWGFVSFVALLVLVFLIVREFGTKSMPFRISLVAVVDFVIQGILGFVSVSSNDALLVHLTNAFILVVLVTTLIGMVARTQPLVKKTSQAAPA